MQELEPSDIKSLLAKWQQSSFGKIWRASTNLAGLLSPAYGVLSFANYDPGTDSETMAYKVVGAFTGTILFPLLRNAPMYLKSRGIDLSKRIRETAPGEYPNSSLLERASGHEALRNFYVGFSSWTLYSAFSELTLYTPILSALSLLSLAAAALSEKWRRDANANLEALLET